MSVNMEQWLWKVEPVSPCGAPSMDIESNWLILQENLLENTVIADEPVLYDEQHTRAEVATKLLAELDELITEEEPLGDWFEEKVNFSIFDGLPMFAAENGQQQNKPIITKSAKLQAEPPQLPQQQQEVTKSLLQEFESILGGVEACYKSQLIENLTLTPPLSPEKTNNEEIYQFVIPESAQQENPVLTVNPEEQVITPVSLSPNFVNEEENVEQWDAENLSLASLCENSNIEIKEECSNLLGDDASLSPSSPCGSSSTYAASCVSFEDSTDDPDWSEIIYEKNKPRRSTAAISRRQRKPYSKSTVEEKKVRKKEQNKNAATRYRQKKKQEVFEILSEEQQLAINNEKLKGQVVDLQREIGYLKGLMRDLFKAKGLIK